MASKTKPQAHTPGFTSRGPDCTDGDVKLCPLHAAAPDLLKAAMAGLKILEETPGNNSSWAARLLRAAIAKAQERL